MKINETKKVKSFLSDFALKFDRYLISFIPKKKFFSNKLYNAMSYVIGVGGKRLRPVFLTEISKLLGIDSNYSFRAAVSVELVHCYSLVHDDLPAMDNDDIRRGKPSTHKKFGEATAVLAGNSLLTLAFEILLTKKIIYHLNKKMK